MVSSDSPGIMPAEQVFAAALSSLLPQITREFKRELAIVCDRERTYDEALAAAERARTLVLDLRRLGQWRRRQADPVPVRAVLALVTRCAAPLLERCGATLALSIGCEVEVTRAAEFALRTWLAVKGAADHAVPPGPHDWSLGVPDHIVCGASVLEFVAADIPTIERIPVEIVEQLALVR